MLTLRKIENVPTGANNRPKLTVKIVGKSLSFFPVFEATLTCVQNAVKCSTSVCNVVEYNRVSAHDALLMLYIARVYLYVHMGGANISVV